MPSIFFLSILSLTLSPSPPACPPHPGLSHLRDPVRGPVQDDTPYDAAFEWASNHVTSASVPTRVRLWREVMSPRLSDPDQLPPKAAWQTVAELLRATLHTYEDKDSQAAVADTLRAFCAVAPEFTSVFARVTAKKSKK